MHNLTTKDYLEYKIALDKPYQEEFDSKAGFSMITSLTPAATSKEESRGFVDRFKIIKKFWEISDDLFYKSLFDGSLSDIRDLILNEVNCDYGFPYHCQLYKNKRSTPYFFRTDECIPGKLTEIQSPGSGWGNLNALQLSASFLTKKTSLPIRDYNQDPLEKKLSREIKKLVAGKPFVYHQLDESSNMLDMNYFVNATRKYGIRYLGRDVGVSFNNVNFVRSHSFMHQVTGSLFKTYLEKFYRNELIFDIFPSILFYQKIPLTFPFWKKTRKLYTDEIRDIFPFSSLVTDVLVLENEENMSIEKFAEMVPNKRDYYLKYGGADGSINWGSKAVFHLGKTSRKNCLLLLQKASSDFKKGKFWIIQKAYHRKDTVEYLNNEKLDSVETYSKWSGFYGPGGFLGGYVMGMNRSKVHGQDHTICRLIS